MLNVARMLVQKSTKHCNLFAKEFKLQCLKEEIMFLTAACLQCQGYHTTSIYLKMAKPSEMKKTKRQNVRMIAEPKKAIKSVSVWDEITIGELADECKRTVSQVEEALCLIGIKGYFNARTPIADFNIIKAVVKKFGYKLEIKARTPKETDSKMLKEKELTKRTPINPATLIPRHPVVTIMGHVDHGKTTLLDALRNTSVVDSEFGGITQHIGAFNVTLSSGEKITFLDTPGHAAFKTMRERGANVTDIVVLVVAADDGVMEQTLQSISMIRDANVPMIVAINKIDKPNADVQETKRMLSQHGVIVEDLGGDVQSVNISALKKLNLDLLKDAIITQAEVLDLKGDPSGLAEGVIIEASMHPGKGKVATCLIQRGIVKRGTVLVCGTASARVRSMYDHAGNQIVKAKLSDAVQIIGWKSLPLAGDEILEVENEQKANEIIRLRQMIKKEELAAEHGRESEKKLEEHLAVYKEQLKKKRASGMLYVRTLAPEASVKETEDDHPKVNILLKGDVVGSVEAILDVLVTYRSHDSCSLSILQHDVGSVTESDIEMAKIFNAIIYCFNVEIPKNICDLAKKENVKIHQHNIIYKLIDDLKDEISNKLPPLEIEEDIGEAILLKEFEINDGKKEIKVAGCRCTKGTLKKSSLYKIIRDDEVISKCKLVSMRHLKSEVDSIKIDMECGLRFDDTEISFQPGDKIVSYKLRYDPQYTDWDPGF